MLHNAQTVIYSLGKDRCYRATAWPATVKATAWLASKRRACLLFVKYEGIAPVE